MKQFCKWWLCVFVIFGVAGGVTSAQEEWMPDPNLWQTVREALELPDEIPLTQPMMNQLTGLDAADSQITDLTGLEHATNLTWLNLGVNEIRDLSPLARLVRLEALWIFSNPLSDLSPLSNLVNLKTLDLGGCQVSGLRPLTNLRNLESLRLHWNQIEDIAPLANLTKLRELWLTANRIVDVSPLANLEKLTDLQIAGNAIRDFSPLLGLNLKSVDVDIRMLHGLASIKVEIPDLNLERAVRRTLELPDEVPLTQLMMSQLMWLAASDSQITDLTGLVVPQC